MTGRFWKRLEKHLVEVEAERTRHLDKWGEQSLDLVDDTENMRNSMELDLSQFRWLNDYAGGGYNWYSVLQEEVMEAFLAENYKDMREEFIQVAAVALAIVNDLDKKEEAK